MPEDDRFPTAVPAAQTPAAWRAADADFFRPMLAFDELAPIAESCGNERRLHAQLSADPTRAVRVEELAALADANARENYAVFLSFRDAVTGAGSLEAYYLGLVRSPPVTVPPAFVDAVVAAIVGHVVDERCSALERRAAQLLHRAQRVAIRDGRVLCADRIVADRASATTAGIDLVGRLVAGSGDENDRTSMPVLGATSAQEFERSADPYAFVLDLTHEIANDLGHGLTFTMARSDSGMSALARVLERWIAHFFGIATTIRPLQRIDDPAWRWHVGLDAEATAILNDLYRGETLEDERLRRLIGLFRLDFDDPGAMRADVAGKPVYLGLATSTEQTLKLKPQNLLLNLPLAALA